MIILDLLPLAIAAISLGGCVWLFVLLKVELRKNARRHERDQLDMQASCAQLGAMLEQLRIRVDELTESDRMRCEPAVQRPRPSLQLNHRAQVLRMARRGERPDQIATALGVPQGEVELLLKLHLARVAAAG